MINHCIYPPHKPHKTAKQHSCTTQMHMMAHALHAMMTNAADNQLKNSKIPNNVKENPRPSQITAHATYSPTHTSTQYQYCTYHLPPMANLHSYTKNYIPAWYNTSYTVLDLPNTMLIPTITPSTIVLLTIALLTSMTTTGNSLIRPFILRTTYAHLNRSRTITNTQTTSLSLLHPKSNS